MDREEKPVKDQQDSEVQENTEEGGEKSTDVEKHADPEAPEDEAPATPTTPTSDNPLALKETNIVTGKGNAKKKKKPAMTKEKSSALDLINARLAQLEKKENTETSTETEVEPEREKKAPQQDPHKHGLCLFAEGGEPVLREAFQKAIQETKRHERDLMMLKRKNEQLTKEKERQHIETAEVKASQQRSQIKCLELQKQIKALKEAADNMESEKETQRNELEAKFQAAIDEITAKLHDGNEERDHLRKENTELDTKVQAIELECGERFEKYQSLHEEKAELLQEKKEQQKVTEQTALSERQKTQLTEEALMITTRSCSELRAQIKMYTDRMEEFEDSITKSKDVFGTFGKELVKMKDHCDALQASRDEVKAELTTLEKSVVTLNSTRIKNRKLIEQQITANTKQKETASRLSTRRNTWKPYLDHITKWFSEQAAEQDVETQE
eukprot:TRINITY_DN1461_c3_g2_i1.p1 TRINITY_DN1461_c3_g2~~TRINITY_DN1461_c3_g2_i1.p1  ORF type:complete len:442 (+),score=150.09 TRINITY_DN1461_c3_g2_i1:70-1395(+)